MMAYALREEAFRDWVPKILDRSVLSESEYTIPEFATESLSK